MIDNKALFKIGYGLYVLAVREGEKDNACIVNVAQQITSDPLQLMLCVNKGNLTHDMLLRTARFNLCALSEEATMKPFQHFGMQSGRTVDKFAECTEVLRAENGIIYLPKFINSFISGQVNRAIDMKTHTMFIANVMESRVLTDVPSITYAYYQEHIKPKATAPAASGKKKWVCEVCGYEYEGDSLPDDFVCPICKHGKSDFREVV